MLRVVRVGVNALALALGVAAAGAQTAVLPLLPSGIAYDAGGDLFIADTARNQVFESTVGGILRVVAGAGAQGFDGDGGPAGDALLNAPQGVAVGADGTLYIADTGNQRVRAVSAGGTISTVAGNGVRGFGGDGGAATSALLNGPVALAVDAAGAVLIADSGNQRVRRVSAGTIATIAGTGVQGFGGDGGAATAALLDTPAGIAVGSDGRIVIADAHNHRLRVIAPDGTMATLAGTGEAGFAGDGGPAVSAKLLLPQGVAILPGGSIVFADSGNQRLRAIDAKGTISTVAGAGVQGVSADGSLGPASALDTLHGVALSSYGAPVFAERANRLVRALVNTGGLYAAAGMSAARTSTLVCNWPANATYGAAAGMFQVQGTAGTPQGTVVVSEGANTVMEASLQGAAVTQTLATLNAGAHTLAAAYSGDGFNPAASCAPGAITIAPAPVVASASGASVPYGAALPALTGTATGILPQDAAGVQVVFATAARVLSPPGSYAITASLSGTRAGNYSVSAAPDAGQLRITQAASTIALSPVAASYAGLPLTLSARLASTTSGVPTGTVTFSDGGVVVASATASGGVATAVYLNPAAGSHSLSASYAGDGNFLPSSAAPETATVAAMPDFTLAVNGAASETVQAGTVASFALTVAGQPGPFSGAVNLSAQGLPAGAAVSFSPPTVVPGSSSAAVTMTVGTSALAMTRPRTNDRTILWAFLLPGGVLVGALRRRWRVAGMLLLLIAAVGATGGCGARVVPESAAAVKVYSIVVTATGTNLAGAVVAHSTTVSLSVQ